MPAFTTQLISFAGPDRIAIGNASDVALQTMAYGNSHPDAQILVFDTGSGKQVELDLRGTPEELLRRFAPQADATVEVLSGQAETIKPGRGRPRLGVAAREVTLLPRHWDWLSRQPGGASVSLRKLVEKSMRDNREIDLKRERIESTYRFMLAMAGNEPGFEEASRALFADDIDGFGRLVAAWPQDIRRHCLVMARDERG